MKLPPLRAVHYFEAVARLNSFSRAAEFLSVTQSAVSHQVRLLEDYLGEELFQRQGRQLSLTPVGEKYYEQISHALADISEASQQIREGEGGKIRLALYSSLAVKWLIPRLENLRQLHPEIELTLNMVSNDPNFSDELADCFITVSPPKRSNFISELLYHEQLYPVCSHKLWLQMRDKPLPDALWEHPLLTTRSIFKDAKHGEDWHRWCMLGGFELPEQARFQLFSHMLLAAEAARYDQGITFLNDYLMNDIDRQQHFVRIPMHELPTGDSFYFVYKKSRAKQTAIITLGRWLKQQCDELDRRGSQS